MEDFWKKAFIALVIAVVAIGCFLTVQWKFTQVQLSFNKRLASETSSINAQLRELRARVDAVEGAINDLDAHFSADQARQDQEMGDLEEDLGWIGNQVNNMDRELDQIWTDINEIEMKIKEFNCTVCECPWGSCYGNYTCDRWGCYCSECGRYIGP